MTQNNHSKNTMAGVGLVMGAGIGAALGIVASQLLQFDLAMGLIFGAGIGTALGLLFGAGVDAQRNR